ncbi:MAG: hypothetical protein JST25_13540 [Actinobacteria bacterium]|nr:hypothetical protein [Actinomycetota bacterium]
MTRRAAQPLRRATLFLAAGLLLVAIVPLSGCSASDPGVATASPGRRDLPAYIADALAVMDAHGLYADSDPWRAELASARARAVDIDSQTAAYALLREAVVAAGGEHSVFLTPADATAMTGASGEPIALPRAETAEGITVVTLPSLAAPPGTDDARSFLAAGRSAIAESTAATTCGWVLDLTANGGGNGLTMLDAIRPLLDTGRATGFLYPDGRREWLPGDSEGDGHGLGPVAVVTSGITRSAAELVAAALDHQEGTVRVGQPTAGLTTSNQVFPLSDGAEIVLTTAWFMNRDGERLDGPMMPDVGVARGEGTGAALLAAQDWIRSRCARG